MQHLFSVIRVEQPAVSSCLSTALALNSSSSSSPADCEEDVSYPSENNTREKRADLNNFRYPLREEAGGFQEQETHLEMMMDEPIEREREKQSAAANSILSHKISELFLHH